MAECELCKDNKQVEIVVTLPDVLPVGTTTCPCPWCLADDKEKKIVDVRSEGARRVINRNRWSDAIWAERKRLRAENAKLRAERDQLREACHVALDTVQWDHGREAYAKLVRALNSTEDDNG